MSMASSIVATEWKGEETPGRDTQGQRAFGGRGYVALLPQPVLAEPEFISRASWEGSLRYAVQRSGKDDFEVADEMAISHGYISKVLKGVAGLYGKRLVRFMQLTGSVAPLQWMADQVGYELHKKAPESENDRLRRELADAHRELRRRA